MKCPRDMPVFLVLRTGKRIPVMEKEARVLLLFIMLMELEPEPSIKSLGTRILTLVLVTTEALLREKRMPS
jgi:hypothetical protein